MYTKMYTKMQRMQLSSWIISDKNGSSFPFFGWHLQKLIPDLSRDYAGRFVTEVRSEFVGLFQVANSKLLQTPSLHCFIVIIMIIRWRWLWQRWYNDVWYKYEVKMIRLKPLNTNLTKCKNVRSMQKATWASQCKSLHTIRCKTPSAELQTNTAENKATGP